VEKMAMALGWNSVVGLLDGRRSFLLAAEDDLLVLHVGAQTVGDVVGVLGRFRRVWLRRVSQL
jgi:hypothetical protein